VRIEQAIFTSVQSGQGDGYRLVAKSPGINQDEARQLKRWGPGHNSLLDCQFEQGSFNFHALESGTFCISRTIAAGNEYSNRGGARLFTRCLVVSPQALDRFANDPFRLFEAASSSGELDQFDGKSPNLDPISLIGRATPIDQDKVKQLAVGIGTDRIAVLLKTMLTSKAFAVAAAPRTDLVFAGLLNLLPRECRLEYSFTTGLRFSAIRPYRCFAIGNDLSQQRQLERQPDVGVIDLRIMPVASTDATAQWSNLVVELITKRRLDLLTELFKQNRPGLKTSDLAELAQDFRWANTDIATNHSTDGPQETVGVSSDTACSGSSNDSSFIESPPAPTANPGLSKSVQRKYHAGQTRKSKRPTMPGTTKAGTLDLTCNWTMDSLQQLDDTVFAAFEGDSGALEALKALWPEMLSQLDPKIVNESREAFLQRALATWNNDNSNVRNLEKAAVALDVLALLFGDI